VDGGGDAPDGAGGTDQYEALATTGEPVEPFDWQVTSVDFRYELATAEVPAGPVEVIQTNEGEEDHQVTLIRLEDGQTPDDLLNTIATEGDDVLDPAAFAGGPNGVPSGETNSAVVNVTPGEYVAYCFLPEHAAQGMIEPFTVTGDAVEPAPMPSDEGVGLEDFQFNVPADFTGQGTVEVVNNGRQAHELTIVDTEAGAGAGGLTTIAPGSTGYIPLDLAPGTYQFVCFVTDPESGQIHAQLGMQQDVVVT
jgi:plastocyanin